MRDFDTPDGIDYSTPQTTPPATANNPVRNAASQFGVEQNQVGQTVANLSEKAQVDLANKANVQKNG